MVLKLAKIKSALHVEIHFPKISAKFYAICRHGGDLDITTGTASRVAKADLLVGEQTDSKGLNLTRLWTVTNTCGV